MDRAAFFAAVRLSLFDGKLSAEQVKGMEATIDAFERQGLTDTRWLAYMLATAYHETGRTMAAILENLNYSEKALLATFSRYFSPAEAKLYARKPEKIANRAYANRMGNGSEASGDGWKYRGRGLVQLTGKANYITYGIQDDPDRALDLGTAVRIMITGMTTGAFTGKKLSDYFSGDKADWVGARRIINHLDKAGQIAEYARKFHTAIEAA